MSYGTNAPQGFQTQNTQTSATFTGQMVQYPLKTGYDQNIFSGDPVVLADGYLKVVTDGATVKLLKDMPLGIFQGCQWNSPDANIQGLAQSPYWAKNTVVQPWGGITSAYAWIITDPHATWNLQVSTSADAKAETATVKAEQIGFYATWSLKSGGNTLSPQNPGAGNTATGQSGVYLDASSLKNDPVGLPLVILGFTPDPRNSPGKPFCNVIVGWNPKIVKPSA